MEEAVVLSKRQKRIAFLISLILAFSMIFGAPFTAFGASGKKENASGSNDPSNVNISVSSSGSDEKVHLNISGGGFGNDQANAWSNFLKKYRNFIVGVAGIGAVTMIVIFIIQFMKLGASAGNPQARSQALIGILWSGIAAAGLGAVTIIVGFFYDAFD